MVVVMLGEGRAALELRGAGVSLSVGRNRYYKQKIHLLFS